MANWHEQFVTQCNVRRAVILHRFRRGAASTLAPVAYIVDGAEALFGNSSSLSAAERESLLQLAFAVRDAPCSLDFRAQAGPP